MVYVAVAERLGDQLFTADPKGEVVIDPSGKLSGRGAYLCPRPDCLRAAQKRKSLDRALKAPIPAEAWARLEEAFLERLATSD